MVPPLFTFTSRRPARPSRRHRGTGRLLAEVLERRFAPATFAGTTGTTVEQAIDANSLPVSSVGEFTVPAYVLIGPSTSAPAALVQASKTTASPAALTNMSLWFGNGDFAMTNGSTTVTPAVTATSKPGVPNVTFGTQGSFVLTSASPAPQFPAANGAIAVQGNNGGWGVWQYDTYASGTFTGLAPIGTNMSGATSAAASMEILPGSTVVQAAPAAAGTTLATVGHVVEAETLFDITIVSGAGFSATGGTAEWYAYGSQAARRFTYTDMVSSGGAVTLQNCLSPDSFTIGVFDTISVVPTVSLPVTTLTAPTLATPNKTIASLLDTPNVPLAVASTTGFPMPAGGSPEYLLIEKSLNGSRTPQALVSYFSRTATQFLPATGNGFALISGPQDLVLDGTTRVVPAPIVTTTTPTGSSFKSIMGQTLATGFIDITDSGGESAFAKTGFIAVFGAGGYGIFSYDESSSVPPSSTTTGTFTGLTLVACQTGNGQDPYAVTIPVGTNVIPAPRPARGLTAAADVTGGTTWPLAVTAATSFDLPVVSTDGFPAGGGSVLVSMTVNGTPAVELVSYTKAVANSGGLGGGVLQGCTVNVPGSIPVATAVNATATAPIPLQFTNNSENNMPVYATIAAKQIALDGKWKWVALEPQKTAGKPDLTKPLAARDVTYTTGKNTYLSAFSLFAPHAAKGALQTITVTNDPTQRLDSARVVFSYGQPAVIATVFDAGNNVAAPSFPDAGSPTDPNGQIHYDFFEFTERSAPNDGTIFVNTTQVDAVGLPFTLSVSPADPSRTNGVGFTIGWNQLRSRFVTYVDAKTKQLPTSPLPAASQVEHAYLAMLTARRLLSPKDAFTNPPSKLDPAEKTALDTYFDAALTTFFSKYYAGPGGGKQQLKLQRDGLSWVGETKVGFDTNYTVMQFTQYDTHFKAPVAGGAVFNVYAPYFSNNGAPLPAGFPRAAGQPTSPAAPSFIAAPTMTPGQMVFANAGVFASPADGAGNAALDGYAVDVQNTLVSAFNRGCANIGTSSEDLTNAWQTAANFYPDFSPDGSNWSNLYAGLLHRPAVTVTGQDPQVGLAYGFAYDDQGGNDPTLVTTFPRQMSITLLRLAGKTQPIPTFTSITTKLPQGSATNELVFAVAALASTTSRPVSYQAQVWRTTASGQPWKLVGLPVTLVQTSTAGAIGTWTGTTGTLQKPANAASVRYAVLVSAVDESLAFTGQFSSGWRTVVFQSP